MCRIEERTTDAEDGAEERNCDLSASLASRFWFHFRLVVRVPCCWWSPSTFNSLGSLHSGLLVCIHVLNREIRVSVVLIDLAAIMSSDGYFDDDFDDAMLQELDAIEAAESQPKASTSKQLAPPPLSKNITLTDDSFNDSFNFDETDLQILDQIEQDYQTQANRPSNLARTSSKGMVQTTLSGGILTSGPSKPNSAARLSRQPSGQQSRKTKKWDHTAFAKSGMKSTKKGKEKAKYYGDEEEEEEAIEFEQFPAPFIPSESDLSTF